MSAARAGSPVAVIDIGSNSGRVAVYRLFPGGHARILASSRASLRLVRGLDRTHALGSAAVSRALESLRDFRAIAAGGDAQRVEAVATAAVRDAADGPAWIRRVRRELGIDVRVLSGDEEARYGFLGAVRGLPADDGMAFDLGGGSLQVSRFRGRRLGKSWSFPLGALRLSDAFLRSDPPSPSELRRLRRHVLSILADAGVGRLARGERLVGTGGTLRNLARIDRRRRGYPIIRLHGYSLSLRRAQDVVGLLAARRLKKRSRVAGLNDDRGDSIVGGGLAIVALMKAVGAAEVLVSGHGVREGIALGLTGDRLPPAPAVRAASVAALADGFRGFDEGAGQRRAALAALLRRHLMPEAGGAVDEALVHGARILDVGSSIDFFDRHEHVAEIVLATDLLGFSHRDLALVSAVVASAGDEGTDLSRYEPLLRPADRSAIARAGVLLALADDIEERCPGRAPIRARCRVHAGRVTVTVPGLLGWRPRRIAGRFADAFGRELRVRA